MSETPEHSTEPIAPVATSTATVPPPTVPPPTVPPYVPADPVVMENKPNRLYRIAAWVAIAAGSLFIVAVIFFSGFALGRHAGGAGNFGGHHRHHSDMSRQGGPPMMHGWPGQMRGPGMWGPGGGPGMWRPGPDQSGPGQSGPGQPPQQPGPSSPTAPPRP